MADIHAALFIDLHDLDLQLVAHLHHILHLLHTALGQLGDMAKPLTARQKLHEGTEFQQASNPAGVNLSHRNLMHDFFNHLFRAAHALCIIRGDEDIAVLMDIHLDTCLLGDTAHHLAASADDIADLVDVDFDRLHAGGIG